jgi:O-succinylbenzoic acid--CoA ligase
VTDFEVSRAAREAPDALALVMPGGARFTFAELADRVARVAVVLAASGVRPGTRVVTWATTREASLLATLAILELGATLVPVHPRLTAPEAETLVRMSTPVRTFMEDDLDELVERAAHTAPAPDLGELPHDPASPLAVLFTSGTTGRPKGAILSRRAFAASAEASAANLPWKEGDRWLLAMPLCHVGGLSVITRTYAARRAIVLHRRFDADAVLESIAEDGATLLSVVPTMLRRLLDADRTGILPRLRAILVGGAACPRAVAEECARRGILVLATYGLTEACSQVTTQRPRDPHTSEPGAGHPLPGMNVRSVDGRIHIRGPTLMDGYLGEAPLAPGAWLDTGDLGDIDEGGRLVVHARRVDLIVTGGENVYPAEVEAAIESCPGVRRAFVFGVPDANWGELVACAIEKDPSRPTTEAELQASIAKILATHKRPRRVAFVDALPTAGDKIDRIRAQEANLPRVRPWLKG